MQWLSSIMYIISKLTTVLIFVEILHFEKTLIIVYSAYSHNVVDDGPVTKVSCLDSGHFLGNSSLEVVTIVDTPGKA
jgi:hypothetical protein